MEINDGAPRQVWHYTNAEGLIIHRHESPNSAPNTGVKASYFYFDGVRYGETSNDGDPETDYSITISRRNYAPTNLFKYGSATSYADFDQSYDPINDANPGGSSSSYTAADGDTLQGIAQAVWGDASLWYLIAQANGLSSSDTLVSGIMLKLPSAVANSHNNSETFRPYDPNKAMGNVSPTQAKPPPKADKGCGVIGMIIVIIVVVVVTVLTWGALTGPAAGAGGAAIGGTATTTGGVAVGGGATIGVGVGGGAAVGGAVGTVAGGLSLGTGAQ